MNLLLGVSMDSGEFATEIINSDSERNGITLDYFRKEIVFMTAATNRKDQVLPMTRGKIPDICNVKRL